MAGARSASPGVSSGTAAGPSAHEHAGSSCRRARPPRADRPPACSAGGGRWRHRGSRTRHDWRAPSAAGASWRRGRRSGPGAPAPGRWAAGPPPAPVAARPSSDSDRSGGPGPRCPLRSPGAARQEASPVPGPSPPPRGVASGRGPRPRPRSSPTPSPLRCHGAADAAHARVCTRRSTRSGLARSRPPPRPAPAGLARPASSAAGAPPPAAAPAAPRSAGRVGGTRDPSHPPRGPVRMRRAGSSLPYPRSRLERVGGELLADLLY